MTLRGRVPKTFHESAFDEAQGLALAEAHVPDLVVLDVELAGSSGEAFATAMRARPALSGSVALAR